MNLSTFESVIRAFVDGDGDYDYSAGKLTAVIRDEAIEASVIEEQGDLFVLENSRERMRAYDWICTRIARLDQLADRITTRVSAPDHFVTPSGKILDYLEDSPEGAERFVDDIPHEVCDALGRSKAGTTSALYLTSDAGEGKTTLIDYVAHQQASKYKRRESGWLLVPIRLGGRSFLTFDDVVVAELVNRLRFQLFYYQAFLELVRLRVLVPAFDGFEEMFVEGSSGEALSALGNLMSDLRSSGAVLISARKAYFEHQSFRTQARLFDALDDNAVEFGRVELSRWTRQQFLDYADKRGSADGPAVFGAVSTRLGEEHPLLTRAVLVKRLLDVAEDQSVDEITESLGADPKDYFFQFVNKIVEREATEKWINRSGTPHVPLLTVEQHHSLLASVAREMWVTSAESLRGDYLDLIAELFATEEGLTADVSRQVRKRLHQHSLIASTAEGGQFYSFDHEDFRQFYLGEAFGALLCNGREPALETALQRGVVSAATADAAINSLARRGGNPGEVLSILCSISSKADTTSYSAENAGALVARLLETYNPEEAVAGIVFPRDALTGRVFGSLEFRECTFRATSVRGAKLPQCRFINCRFDHISLADDAEVHGAVLDGCTIGAVEPADAGESIRYEPSKVEAALTDAGFAVSTGGDSQADRSSVEPDICAVMAEQTLRMYVRSTHIGEEVLRNKFGKRAALFFNEVLPKLLEANVLQEVHRKGGGKQRKFRLAIPMRELQFGFPADIESLDEYVDYLDTQRE